MDLLKNYSLVLLKDKKIIFSSKENGIKPLVECIHKFKGKTKACILYDKVVGMAAARLIVYSYLIKEVNALVASDNAIDYLIKNKIKINFKEKVEKIMNKDKTKQCRMEELSEKIKNNKKFYLQIKDLIYCPVH